MQARPSATVDLVADIICPWCAIGRRRLDIALAELAGEGLHLDWVWRPFLLYPGAPPGGFAQAPHLLRRFGSAAAADRYHDGVAEAGRAVGMDFRYDRIKVTPNTIGAHRLLLLAAMAGRQQMLAARLAQAFFTDGRDLGDTEILAGLAGASGMDEAAARAMLHGDKYRAEVPDFDAAAKRAGIKHVPAFCLHGRIIPIHDVEALAGLLRAANRTFTRSDKASHA